MEIAELKNRIIKTELVKWKELRFIQPDSFKELSKEAYKKLKTSLLNNDFVTPFAVWQDKDSKIYVIDGVHRVKVLTELEKEGHFIQQSFPANFIDCKNRKEAAKLVLVYSSTYAKTTLEGMDEFLNMEDLNIEEMKLEIDIPDLDLKYFDDPAGLGTEFELPDGDKEAFQQMTFTLADKQAEFIKEQLDKAKASAESGNYENFGNVNSNGNALYYLIKNSNVI